MKSLLFVAAFLALALAAPQADQPAESGPNANAEADPWYGYYGYRPYWGGYYGHRYGYYGYYGKRSADDAAAPAESGPNANAEADPWYGYYGYRPYGYGYYGYRPYGYAYWEAPDMDTTTERGLLMLRLTPGTGTTGTGTDLMAMGTMATDLMVMLTG